ncbi:hypothetical protein TRIP_B170096 [uncultured Desulfatiglans sp.]|nr:hypothetical protein TRIP_B170096 [uncultured Desulfatiglans sp.]
MTPLETLRAAGLNAEVIGGQLKVSGLSRLQAGRREKAIQHAREHRDEIIAELESTPTKGIDSSENVQQRGDMEAEHCDRRTQEVIRELNAAGRRFTDLSSADRRQADDLAEQMTTAANSRDRASFENVLAKWRDILIR